MLTPKMMSMGLRRAPGMIQGVGQRAVQGAREGARLVAENPTMREALLQTVPTKSVSEILSEPLGEMMPDLGGATSSASRQRQIADMLLQGAQSQDNTSIAGGLSQLGQAFLARKAGQKADTAEDKQREMANLLLQQAMGQGPESQAARAQIFADSPAALIAQSDAQRTAQAEQQRTQMQNEMLANLYPEGSKERAMILAGVGTTQAAEQAFAPAPEAPKPIEVNGVLVDPVTYKPVADFRTPAQTGSMTDYQRAQLEAAAAAPQAPSARPMREDPNGVLRYLDGAQEPVFSNVEKTPKPLIGTETMARVATGLPNAKQAVANLRTLLFDSKGTNLSMEGYSPLRDVGAGLVQDVGHIPVIGGLIRGATDSTARMLGGEDYQMFEDAYDTFEAAMLPIMSGAAVPPSEAKRQMQAVKIVPFDSKATKLRKLAAQDQMIAGLEMAANGDTAGFLAALENAGKSVAEVEAEEIDALVQQYGVK